MYSEYNVGTSNNDVIINSIEINAIVKLLASKGLIDANEYKSVLINVGEKLLDEAESKGMLDKRMKHLLVQKLYMNS
jgi:hypothetical protein